MMTYKYAARKIENIYNLELEHIDRIRGLVDFDSDRNSREIWIELMERAVDDYTAAARTVIEIYIELVDGPCENWRDLHKIQWDLHDKLQSNVERLKEIIEKPF